MKNTIPVAIVSLCLALNGWSQEEAPRPVSETPKEAPTPATTDTATTAQDPEARFKAMLTKATLAGRWAPLQDGALGDERTGDNYQVTGVSKAGGETWIVSAKLKYRGREFVLPIPVKVKFAGDTAVLTVDNLAIPNGGTYSARVMFHDHTYSGTWKGGRGGGMLYGVITNDPD